MHTDSDIATRRRRPAKQQAAHAPAIPVFLVVYDGVLLLDVAGVGEPFRLANEWAEQTGRSRPFELSLIAARRTARTSLGGVLNSIAQLPAKLPPSSWLIVPGACRARETYLEPHIRDLVQWLRSVADHPQRRLTVCSGALLAARAGWLDGRRCTTHHDLIDELRHAAPAALVVENRLYVEDRTIATSAGITAGIDLALWAIGEVIGPLGALAVAREMVVFSRRGGDDPQLSAWLAHRNHLHPALHRVQDALAKSPEQSWTIGRMAKAAHVGERHLGRLFMEHAGTTPLRYLSQLRLALAHTLLGDRSRSMESVASAVGFSSAHHLRRVWKQHRQESPRRLPG